ncbi:structural cement protein Gp24, partial [Acinetobacter baumannii]|uniref:structural cement protein Gp24 n=1 Tax=Acinetobacter baumannii TaxID=470 RepID=UPI003F687F4F
MAITNYDKYMPEAGGRGKLANYQDYSADTKAAAEVIPFGAAVQLGADGET